MCKCKCTNPPQLSFVSLRYGTVTVYSVDLALKMIEHAAPTTTSTNVINDATTRAETEATTSTTLAARIIPSVEVQGENATAESADGMSSMTIAANVVNDATTSAETEATTSTTLATRTMRSVEAQGENATTESADRMSSMTTAANEIDDTLTIAVMERGQSACGSEGVHSACVSRRQTLVLDELIPARRDPDNARPDLDTAYSDSHVLQDCMSGYYGSGSNSNSTDDFSSESSDDSNTACPDCDNPLISLHTVTKMMQRPSVNLQMNSCNGLMRTLMRIDAL